MKRVTTVLVFACCAVHAVAQDVPSTAQASGGAGLHGPVRPFFGADGPPKVPAPPVRELPNEVDRQVVEVRSGGRLVARWTTEHRPSAEEWQRQVAESMANRQSLMDHEATKTVVTEEAGRDINVWAGSPSEEAFGRLNDPLGLPGAFEEGILVEDHNSPVGFPPMDDDGLRRLLEPWSHQHGFGPGRAD